MSTNGSTNNVTAIETDMRDGLRERKARLSNVRETDNDYSSFVSGISVRSVQEIDHLIEGLQGLREKLNNDGAAVTFAFARSLPPCADAVVCAPRHSPLLSPVGSVVTRGRAGTAQWRRTGKLATLSFWKAALILGSCFMTRRADLAYRSGTPMTRKLSRAETSWLLR